MRRAAFVGVGACLVACGLSVVGVAPEPSAADAGLVIESGAVDPGVDAAPADVTVLADATTFCEQREPKPTFCADFDRPGVDPGWTPFPLDAGASVDVSGLNLHATATNEFSAALVTKKLCPTGFTLEFEVRFDRVPPAGGDGKISPILVTPPDFPGHDIYFFFDEETSYFQEYGDTYSAFLRTPALHVWHHFSLDVTTVTATTFATAKIDDAVYWNNETLKHPITNGQVLTFELGVAANYRSNQGGEITIDDVVLRTR